jgi:amino acid transporter
MALATSLRRKIFGSPIHNKRAHHQRLLIPVGLAVFASDALSSVAYSADEVMHVLSKAGPEALGYTFPIAISIAVLMAIVVFSYRQTIKAYPKDGGTYIVSSENLGRPAGLTAGASLMIDYVLTVSVSVSSGVAALISMAPDAQPYGVGIGVLFIAFLTMMNLRGLKESGLAFTAPTYLFIAAVLALIVTGLIQGFGRPDEAIHAGGHFGAQALTPIMILRGFAAACTAMTGTEAISNGVQAFKEPASVNANRTLVIMAVLLMVMFLGVSWMAVHFGAIPMNISEPGYKTVMAQLAERVWGIGPGFYAIQIFTAGILFIAANTAFADFPRLTSYIARDRFLPRSLSSLGDRLVYQNGILLLAVASSIIVVIFQADTHALVPLYAVGVFTAFTLSQSGMAVHIWRERKPGRFPASMLISAVGGTITFIVTCVLMITKFFEGAWVVLVAVPLMVGLFLFVNRHYRSIDKALRDSIPEIVPSSSVILIVVPRLHRGVREAINYARLLGGDIRGVHVGLSESARDRLREDWSACGPDLPLIMLDSPYRSLIQPILDYVDQLQQDEPKAAITVIVPQAVPQNLWQKFLHADAGRALVRELGERRGVVVTSLRYFFDATPASSH